MTNALRAETRRLLSRRIVLLALLGLLALIGLYQLQVGNQVSPPSAAEVAAMQQDYDQAVKDWEANHEEWEADCLDDGGSADDCAEPRPELSDWGLAPDSFQDAVGPAIGFAVYLGGLALFVAMASFMGAERSTGSLANWLTFVPDRNIVLGSKLAVVAMFSTAVGAIAGFLTLGLSVIVTSLFGQPLTGLAEMSAMAARGVIVVALLGIAGFAVATLTGATGAAIGVLLGVVFVSYLQSGLAYMSRWAEHLTPWMPGLNLVAILDGKATYEVSAGPGPTDDSLDGSYVEKTIGLAHGLGYWAVVLVALLAVTWVLFRRRDIT